jgi:hypothetical protein
MTERAASAAAEEWLARLGTGEASEPKPIGKAQRGTSEVARQGDAGTQIVRVERPTHALWRDDSVELVHPEGYSAELLTELPDGFWDSAMVADLSSRTFRPDPEPLRDLTAQLLAEVDRRAGAFRCRFITAIPGQDLTYLAKEEQARAFGAGAGLEAAPMIAAEAEVRGISPQVLSKLVIDRADSWRRLAVLVEARRVQAKEAVAAARDEAGKRAAADVDWDVLLTGGPSSE